MTDENINSEVWAAINLARIESFSVKCTKQVRGVGFRVPHWKTYVLEVGDSKTKDALLQALDLGLAPLPSWSVNALFSGSSCSDLRLQQATHCLVLRGSSLEHKAWIKLPIDPWDRPISALDTGDKRMQLLCFLGWNKAQSTSQVW